MTPDDTGEPGAPPTPTGSIPVAPPTSPGVLRVPTRQAAWPGVVAIACIVLGGLSTLHSAWDIIRNIMIVAGVFQMPNITGARNMPDMNAVMHAGAIPQLFSGALYLILGILLIVMGALLLRRSPAARRGLIVWSIAKIFASLLAAAIVAWVQYTTMGQVADSITHDPSTPAKMQTYAPTFVWSFAAMFAILFFIWGCLWPGFLLIWLNLRSVRAEVAGWRSPGL